MSVLLNFSLSASPYLELARRAEVAEDLAAQLLGQLIA